jgi:SAM-dependent methyltransferase
MLFEDRSRAESFGAIAALYDRARPSYPPELLDALLADGPASVLDVGSGTGIASALFAARGCSVLGVEVDERMAQLARGKGLEVEVAQFEGWDAGTRRFDLVVSAQAWHWIRPRAGAMRAAGVLHTGGRLGVFWNFGHPPREVGELFSSIYARLEPDVERYSVLLGNDDSRAQETLTAIRDCGAFGPVEHAAFPWVRTYETAAWLEQLSTHSDHQALASPRRERLLTAVGEAIDSLGGAFEMHYETVLVSARRT